MGQEHGKRGLLSFQGKIGTITPDFPADIDESTTSMGFGKDAVLVIKLIIKSECLKITGFCNAAYGVNMSVLDCGDK